MIDEYAGQLLTYCFVQQRGHNRRVDTAGKTEQHLPIAYLLAHGSDGIGDDVARCPVARALTDLAHEAPHDRFALQRMRDLGMELHAVEMALAILHRGHRRVWTSRRYRETGRCQFDPVAVAHPHLEMRLTVIGIA